MYVSYIVIAKCYRASLIKLATWAPIVLVSERLKNRI